MQYIRKAESIRFDRDKSLASSLTDLKTYVQRLPDEQVNLILNSSAYDLGMMLNKGQTTSVEIVKIFSYRAATIGKDYNAISEDNFKQALIIADKYDQIRLEKKWNNGSIDSDSLEEFSPLFGVPISVKDGINLKGFSSTLGCVERYSEKCEIDGNIITVLKTAGLIPFVKSNMPQLGMAYQSENRMFGAVKNPWNLQKISGGSTGGQASLLASRSSVLGIGSDIGGSLRNPAEFCGICSLKPGSQRVMVLGHAKFSPSIMGQTIVKCCVGPMARHVDDLACFMKIVCDQNNYPKGVADPYKKIIPFDWKIYKQLSEKPQKLRVGYFESLEIFPSSKASQRAVHQVVQMLKQKGHTLIPVKVPCIIDIINVMVSAVVAEGGLKGYSQMLKGEPMLQLYKLIKIASKLPKFLHWILSKALTKLKPRMGMVLSFGKQLTSYEYLSLADKCQNVKRAFIQMWRQDNLDFIICPGFALQAPTKGTSNDLGTLPALYNFMWNVLDVPTGCVPVTLCRQDEQLYQSPYNDPFHDVAVRIQSTAKGLPAGIQVVGFPFQQQKVLGFMKYVQSQVKFALKHPYPI